MHLTPAQRRQAAAGTPERRLRAASACVRGLHQTPDSEAEAMYWRNLAGLFDDTAAAIETDGIDGITRADNLLITLAEGYLLSPHLDTAAARIKALRDALNDIFVKSTDGIATVTAISALRADDAQE